MRIDIAGGSVTDSLVGGLSGDPVVLDATRPGQLSMQICAGIRARAAIVRGRLQISASLPTNARCLDPLEDLVRLDGTRVEVDGSTLVLRRTDQPRFRYSFVRTDAATALGFWGHTWKIRELTDAGGAAIKGQDTLASNDHGLGFVDTTRFGRVKIGTCAGPFADASVQGVHLLLASHWATLTALCKDSGPLPEATQLVQAILSSSPRVHPTGGQLVISSPAGRLVATPVIYELEGANSLVPHRWMVVEAQAHGKPIDLVGYPTLTAAQTAVSVSGEPDPAGGPMTLTSTGNGVEQKMTVGVDPIDRACGSPLCDQRRWFDDFFSKQPTLVVIGDRAVMRVPGAQVLLVRHR